MKPPNIEEVRVKKSYLEDPKHGKDWTRAKPAAQGHDHLEVDLESRVESTEH